MSNSIRSGSSSDSTNIFESSYRIPLASGPRLGPVQAMNPFDPYVDHPASTESGAPVEPVAIPQLIDFDPLLVMRGRYPRCHVVREPDHHSTDHAALDWSALCDSNIRPIYGGGGQATQAEWRKVLGRKKQQNTRYPPRAAGTCPLPLPPRPDDPTMMSSRMFRPNFADIGLSNGGRWDGCCGISARCV